MATTDITINVTASTDTFAFPFPYLKAEDVRVELREFDTTPGAEEPLISTSASTNFIIPEANPTTIEFTSLGAATIYQNADGTVKVTSDNNHQVQVRIYRNTSVDATPATFFAGSAVRAKDLNDNFEKILYIMQERQNFLSNIVAGQFPTESLTSSAFETDSVTSRVLRDDPTIDSNRAVTTNHIRDNAVTMAKLAGGILPTDITVSTDNITGNTIVNADISNSAAIAQSKLDLSITDSEVSATANISGSKISPNFSGQNITTLGNLSVNDATISGDASVTGTATISGLTYPTSDGSADEVLKTNGTGTLSFGTIQGVPTGSVFYFAASTAPTGYLKANGDTVPNGTGTIQGVTADFSALYAILGSTYGSAGQLPDLRGEFMRGWDDGKGIDSGRTFGSSQSDQVEEHNHGTSILQYTGSSSGFPNLGPGSPESYNVRFMTAAQANHGGTDNSSENRPRNVALLACIKY